jgi:hypothetical protein
MPGSEAQLTPDLRPFTAPLRRLLDGGELAECPPIVHGGRAWPPERLVRIMLADADHYGDLPAAVRGDPEHRARMRDLARELLALGAALGAIPSTG